MDCGDGAVHRLIGEEVNFSSISEILISHHHSDHVTGLTSIIETMAIKKRNAKLSVYGPPGLKEVLFNNSKDHQRSIRSKVRP